MIKILSLMHFCSLNKFSFLYTMKERKATVKIHFKKGNSYNEKEINRYFSAFCSSFDGDFGYILLECKARGGERNANDRGYQPQR